MMMFQVGRFVNTARPSLARALATKATTSPTTAAKALASSVSSRLKSSLPDIHVDHEEFESSHESEPTRTEVAPAPEPDSTYSHLKSGTPSPWAVFDAWGAGADIVDPLSPAMEKLLTKDTVKIPTTQAERESLAGETEILEAYDQFLQRKSSIHFGYPYNLMYNHAELYNFMRYSINNLGDPFIPSNYGVHSRQFECAVIDFFADLWHMEKDSYWGYVTTSGTEGNLHGILLARECHPDAILYTSQETHYSVFKAARYYRMDCQSIPTLPMGEIDYDLLEKAISRNLDRDIIIVSFLVRVFVGFCLIVGRPHQLPACFTGLYRMLTLGLPSRALSTTWIAFCEH
jgi:Pyridoxal-dependent decarboxylase conserved domain